MGHGLPTASCIFGLLTPQRVVHFWRHACSPSPASTSTVFARPPARAWRPGWKSTRPTRCACRKSKPKRLTWRASSRHWPACRATFISRKRRAILASGFTRVRRPAMCWWVTGRRNLMRRGATWNCVLTHPRASAPSSAPISPAVPQARSGRRPNTAFWTASTRTCNHSKPSANSCCAAISILRTTRSI